MGYQTSLNLKEIIAIVSFKQNMNLKIQILAENTLMSRFHVGFEIELPLDCILKTLLKAICFSHVFVKYFGNFLIDSTI